MLKSFFGDMVLVVTHKLEIIFEVTLWDTLFTSFSSGFRYDKRVTPPGRDRLDFSRGWSVGALAWFLYIRCEDEDAREAPTEAAANRASGPSLTAIGFRVICFILLLNLVLFGVPTFFFGLVFYREDLYLSLTGVGYQTLQLLCWLADFIVSLLLQALSTW